MAESAPLLRVYRFTPIEGSNPSLSATAMWIGLALLVLILCSGCEQQKENSIQWQLPLEAPEDMHRSKGDATLPAWASDMQGDIKLVFLQKNTAQTKVVSVVKGQVVHTGDWQINVLGLASGLRIDHGAFLNDKSVHNAAAFVELKLKDKLLYRGWLFQAFPELFGLDHPSWKVWLKEVNIHPSSSEEKSGSLSSAG